MFLCEIVCYDLPREPSNVGLRSCFLVGIGVGVDVLRGRVVVLALLSVVLLLDLVSLINRANLSSLMNEIYFSVIKCFFRLSKNKRCLG
jgi:hypothetical protein